ncbi:obscurin-like protein 1 isoform X1 [Haliotis asinina]|uniref:obscurin-like protein 1 isoform X1 n=1 Tax=Haliotis asinina TaxID=109174 RepID=UPI0035321CA9
MCKTMLLPLLCVVLCCITPSQQQTAGFALDPADYNTTVGGFAYFQLILASGVQGDGGWFRNGAPVNSISGKIFITISGDVRQIVIQNVQASEAGTYTFRVGVYEVSATLTINGVAPLSIQAGLQDVNVASGATATFQTTLSQANINNGRWVRNGQQLTNSNKYQITVTGQTQRLVITGVTSSDAGQYSYQVGSLTTSGTLTVQSALSIITGLPDLNVASGATVTFETTLSQANINSGRWIRNGQQLTNSNKYQISVIGQTQRLVITGVTSSDAGQYAYQVGSLTTSGTLTVQTALTIISGLPNLNVASGATVTFETTLSQANINSGRWIRNGQQLTNSNKYQISVIGQTQRLVITGATSSDAGQYAYQVGSLTTSGTLTVQSALSIITGLPDLNVASGATVTFETTLSQANINSGRWIRNGQQLTNSNKYQISVIGQTQRLVITGVTTSDAGQYAYQVGSLTTSGTLTVQSALSIITGLPNLNVASGATVTFETSLSQANVNSGRWIRNGQQLTNSNKYQISVIGQTQRLVITGVTSSDAGQYAYQVGSLTTSGTLTVQSALTIISGLPDLNVASGATVTFETTLSQANVNTGRWIRNGQQLTNSNKYQISVIGQTQRLVITGVTSSDAGQYAYQVGSLTTSGTLTVQALSILSSPLILNLQVGQDATLYVQLSQNGVSPGTWYLNNVVLPITGTRSAFVSSEFHVLVITNVQLSDAGLYQYRVAGLTGEATVNIQGAALSIITGLSDLNVASGATVTFETTLSQTNINSGRWIRNGQQLTNSNKYQISVIGQTQRLVITGVTSSDAGQYAYQVGSLTTSATLTVQSAALSILSGLTNLNVASGATATFETTLSQANVNNGRWIRNGQQLTNSNKYQITVTGQTQRLSIIGATSADAGQYSYQVGSLTTTGTLTVQTAALSILSGLTNLNVASGATATFETTLSQANVNNGRWIRNGQQLTNSNKYQITVTGQTQRLSITGATPADAGQYSYQVGSLTTSGTLTVQTALSITSGLPVRNTASGATAIFEVTLSQANVNNGRWIRNGQQLTNSNKYQISVIGQTQRLVITGVTSSDAGQYVYQVGSLTTTGTLTVQTVTTDLCRNAQNRNGIGYRRHPMDCDKYIQCYYNPNGNVIGVYRTCSSGYYWDQANLKCDEDWKVTCPLERCTGKCKPHYRMDGGCRSYWECSRGTSVAKCCNEGFMYVEDEGCKPNFFCRDTCPSSCGEIDVCNKVPVWGNNIATFNMTFPSIGEITSSCVARSYFDVTDCGCSALDQGCGPRYELDFNNQGSLNFALSTYLSYSNVTVANGIASFNENSTFFANVSISNRNTTHPNIVRFLYRESITSSGRRVLVSGSNCKGKNSLVIAIDNDYITFEVMSWYGRTVKLPVSTAGMSRFSWKRVTLIYSGYDMVVSIASGQITYTARLYASDSNIIECGMRFGSDGSSASGTKFVGELDEISLYSCNPGNLL